MTAGSGRAQRWGGPIEEIRPGDVVWFAPGEKHWHGAAPTTAMTHIAIQERLDGKAVDWMEKVSDDEFTGGYHPGALVPPGPPQRFFGLDQLNRDFRDEPLDPLGHLQHPRFFRHRVPQQDDALRDALRGGVEHIRLAVERAVALLLLAADQDVDVRRVDRRRA